MSIAVPRIVLDTNILVASIGRRSPYRWIFDAVIDSKLVLCVSNEILTEYREIVGRKTNRIVAENLTNFLTSSPSVERFDIYYNFGLIDVDESDNKFVDCAISANADHLVSNDRHFNLLKKIDFPLVSVLTLLEFEVSYRSILSR